MSLLDVKFDETSTESNVNDVTIRVLRGMLRTCYGYAMDKPDEVFLYVQDQGEMTLSFGSLYRFNNKYYEASQLNESDDDTKFDVSLERQIKLQEFLATDVFSDLKPVYEYSGVSFPRQIWASYSINDDDFKITMSFSSTDKNANEIVETWKNTMESPSENPTLDNMMDYPYLELHSEID